jgi:hypothetical protein
MGHFSMEKSRLPGQLSAEINIQSTTRKEVSRIEIFYAH